jgi:uncharacterized phiE125 gp8 family phage protein
MTAALITPPALEPVSLADAKAHLRVGDDADDALIGAAITAARIHVEAATRRVLIEQEWRIYRDDWPASRLVPIAIGPLISVDAVTVYDAGGEPTELDADAYEVDLVSMPGRLKVAADAVDPGRAVNGIEVDVTAGYGASSVEVPAPLRQAILMLVAHWYEHRAAAGFNEASAVAPLGVEALIAPYRVRAL